MSDEFSGLRTVLVGKRILPPKPPGWDLLVREPDPDEDFDQDERDETSGACVGITYNDRHLAPSRRRINFIHVFGYHGGIDTIGAFCHERRAYRTFRFDSIVDMWCPKTGLVLDPREHSLALVKGGAVKANDKALTALAKLLVFVAKCDHDFDASEEEAIEYQIGRYFRNFGGTDQDYERVIGELPRLAPDDRDVVGAIYAFQRAPYRRELARFAIDACAHVIEADGKQHAAEAGWGTELDAALKKLATLQ